jgi:hypothetical protein
MCSRLLKILPSISNRTVLTGGKPLLFRLFWRHAGLGLTAQRLGLPTDHQVGTRDHLPPLFNGWIAGHPKIRPAQLLLALLEAIFDPHPHAIDVRHRLQRGLCQIGHDEARQFLRQRCGIRGDLVVAEVPPLAEYDLADISNFIPSIGKAPLKGFPTRIAHPLPRPQPDPMVRPHRDNKVQVQFQQPFQKFGALPLQTVRHAEVEGKASGFELPQQLQGQLRLGLIAVRAFKGGARFEDLEHEGKRDPLQHPIGVDRHQACIDFAQPADILARHIIGRAPFLLIAGLITTEDKGSLV